MANKSYHLLVCAVFMFCSSNAASLASQHVHSLNRSTFPQGFIFGTASSAYQYEGAAKEGGRGASIWDTYTHKFPDKIGDHSNGDVAVDSYHRYKEDVRIMKNMNLDAYRFSISWSRILPNGKTSGGVNREGIAYYNNLINELLAHDIQPFVTLFHWDLPQTLEDEYGGFLSPRIADDFRNYAELCFQEFGDRVKHWMTLNEPLSYCTGIYSVGVCSRRQNVECNGGDLGIEPYLLAHYQLLAHAAAAKLYKEKYQEKQKGVIGIAVNSNWFVPFSESTEDKNAALRSLDFMFGWFIDPLTTGDYPRTMRSYVKERLPKFLKEQSEMLKGSLDFIGLNYYTSSYASHAPLSNTGKPSYFSDSHTRQSTERNGIPIGPKCASDWLYSYPRGIHDLLLYIKEKYDNPLVYITENGISEANNATSLVEALADHARIDYYYRHLSFIHRAIKHKANVKGYFAWSLLDNFEWGAGYSVRFGINYVDYTDGLKRHPKLSSRWFSSFLRR